MFASESVALEPATVDKRKAVKNYLPSVTSWTLDSVATPSRNVALVCIHRVDPNTLVNQGSLSVDLIAQFNLFEPCLYW